MPGVNIVDNVDIGAGAIVTRDIPSNCVAAGIPAKVIKSIEDYKKKVIENGIIVTDSDPKKREKIIIELLNPDD